MNLAQHWKGVVTAVACIFFLAVPRLPAQQVAATPPPQEGDYVAHDFHFKSGETLPALRIHYRTLGQPRRDANGRVNNAVMILHGTGGSGDNFLRPYFAGVLFGPGELLDFSQYFIILPDAIGHGKSSKPSDGMRAHFPQYEYDDMVAAQHEMLVQGLKVDHLRLLMGTSMGCMHSFVWLETYPGFMDAAMPLACLPLQISGRNRMWRKMIIDGIRQDPEWKNGDYTKQPWAGLEIAADLSIIAGSAPLPQQKSYPTRDAADQYLAERVRDEFASTDANDFLYAVNSSRNYDPSASLEKIVAPVMWINSGDDFINPPNLGIAEVAVKRIKRGQFVLIPASENTFGHGTHTHAAIWQQYLKQLLEESK